jgi:NAD(P)-dependent dehydrogenase (short-subunit alcohol dehydrogenase family)
MSRLAGRVIAVTGASSGIGRAVAQQLAAEGATVIASARRGDRLDALAIEPVGSGGRIVACPGDVTSEADMQALVARAVEIGGRLDVMICNAGIGYHGTLDETSTDATRRVVDVNLMGTLYAAHAAIIAMRRQGHGHIIAVSSIVGRRGVGGSSVYAATKAGQVAFIESLRAEFVGTPFHASVVLPVSTRTEFRDAISRDFGHETRGHGPSQSAEDVARTIVRCVISPKAEVYPLRKAWWLSVLGVVAPSRADRVVQRFGRRRQHRRVDADGASRS